MTQAGNDDPIADFKALVRQVYADVVVDLAKDGMEPGLDVRDAAMTAILALANAGQKDPEQLHRYALSKAKEALFQIPAAR